MGKKNVHAPTSKFIVIDGIYFYKERQGNGYYLGNVPDETGKPKPVRAHVYVWEKANGKVPKGYHVHHKDHDPDNNDLNNLCCIPISKHLSSHSKERSEESRHNMNTVVRPKAIEWHKSEAGSKYHAEHYAKYTKAIWEKPVTKICEVCGKEFTVKHMVDGISRFCSNNCKSKYRRMMGFDNEQRNCIICGKEFTCNKYSKQKTCGNKECAVTSQKMTKLAKSHPQK